MPPITKDSVIKPHLRLQAFIQPWSGQAVRHLPEGPQDIYNFSRAGLADDNRWNRQGEPTLYLARDKDVALAEWARHLRVDRDPGLAKHAKRRKVYRFEVRLGHTLNLGDAKVWQRFSLENAPHCFLDKAIARATAEFVRRTTPAEAIFVPSVAFLDQLDKWVLVVFLEKRPGDLHRFLPSAVEDGEFSVTP